MTIGLDDPQVVRLCVGRGLTGSKVVTGFLHRAIRHSARFRDSAQHFHGIGAKRIDKTVAISKVLVKRKPDLYGNGVKYRNLATRYR
ncbi:hypothetical protein D3C72_1239800 [compost metagenome]